MPNPCPDARIVLIAETDQNVRELQDHFLKNAGFIVEFADDGQAALERALFAHPALVVTEILLPKLDGLALCRRLRDDAATNDIPVVVFSILGAATRAEEAGAKAFLRKPLIEQTFLATVERLTATKPTGIKESHWALE